MSAAIVPDKIVSHDGSSPIRPPLVFGPTQSRMLPDSFRCTASKNRDDFVPDVPAAGKSHSLCKLRVRGSACLGDQVSAPLDDKTVVVHSRLLPMSFFSPELSSNANISTPRRTNSPTAISNVSKPKEVAAVVFDAANKAGRQLIALPCHHFE